MTAPDKAFEEWFESAYDTSCGVDEVMKSGLKEAWLASRKAALEEAAKVCQSHEPKDFTVAGIITRAQCADAILALGDEP